MDHLPGAGNSQDRPERRSVLTQWPGISKRHHGWPRWPNGMIWLLRVWLLKPWNKTQKPQSLFIQTREWSNRIGTFPKYFPQDTFRGQSLADVTVAKWGAGHHWKQSKLASCFLDGTQLSLVVILPVEDDPRNVIHQWEATPPRSWSIILNRVEVMKVKDRWMSYFRLRENKKGTTDCTVWFPAGSLCNKEWNQNNGWNSDCGLRVYRW